MHEKQKKIPTHAPKPEKNLKDASLPPLPFTHQLEKNKEKEDKDAAKIAAKEGPLTVDEASKLLEDLKKKQEKIRQMVKEMYEKRGVSPEFLRKHLSNPNNFTPEEWENLQKERNSYIELMNFPPDMLKDEAVQAFINPESSSKTLKSREKNRAKAGGPSRRGWLPMR